MPMQLYAVQLSHPAPGTIALVMTDDGAKALDLAVTDKKLAMQVKLAARVVGAFDLTPDSLIATIPPETLGERSKR